MKKPSIKIICLLLALLLFALMAAGSGSSSSNGGKTDTKDTSSPTQQNNTDTKDSGSTTTDTKDTSSTTPKTGYTISNETIVETGDCVFRIVEAKDQSIWGFTLKVFCENKTSDKTLMFTVSDVSVNGYMCSVYWVEEVGPGKKSNDEITFGSSAFKDNGITSPDEVVFGLRIYDSDNWSEDSIVDDTFTIYPTGLTANQIKIPDRRTTSTEKVIVDNEYCTFIILDTEEGGSFLGYVMNCYIENKTDKELMFSMSDVSVNGFMIDPLFAESVSPHKRSYTTVSFSTSGLEKNNITKVEEVEFLLKAYDYNDWLAGNLIEDTFTFRP